MGGFLSPFHGSFHKSVCASNYLHQYLPLKYWNHHWTLTKRIKKNKYIYRKLPFSLNGQLNFSVLQNLNFSPTKIFDGFTHKKPLIICEKFERANIFTAIIENNKNKENASIKPTLIVANRSQLRWFFFQATKKKIMSLN